ncbi:response regulator [Candidatus Halobeggiatoa sp. HSG11]|nr:response regulator [Candidatus Halobeggiatoa sp. HSG11]
MNALIIDDSKAQRALLIAYIKSYESTAVIYQAGSSTDAMAKVREIPHLDFITLDQNLDRKSGTDLVPLIREQLPNAHIVMITTQCTKEIKGLIVDYDIELVCKPVQPNNLKRYFL